MLRFIQQRAVQLLIPELKTKVRFSFSTAPWPKEAAKRMQHTTIVLKANMFFHFVDEKVPFHLRSMTQRLLSFLFPLSLVLTRPVAERRVQHCSSGQLRS